MGGRQTRHYLTLFNLLTFNPRNGLVFLSSNNDRNTRNLNEDEERERKGKKKPICPEGTFQFFMLNFKHRENNELKS